MLSRPESWDLPECEHGDFPFEWLSRTSIRRYGGGGHLGRRGSVNRPQILLTVARCFPHEAGFGCAPASVLSPPLAGVFFKKKRRRMGLRGLSLQSRHG